MSPIYYRIKLLPDEKVAVPTVFDANTDEFLVKSNAFYETHYSGRTVITSGRLQLTTSRPDAHFDAYPNRGVEQFGTENAINSYPYTSHRRKHA